jgi:1-deoxy-D-xylulose-5-phosphate synthase
VIGIPDTFIEHGTVEELQKFCKIDVKSLENLFLDY